MAGCTDLQNDLSEYLDGELPASARTALEAHLQNCAACRAALADLKTVAGSLATLPKVKAPAGFAAKISRDIRSAAKPAANVVSIGTARAPRTWLMPSLMSAAALIAAAVLVFAVGPQLQKQQQSQTGVAMKDADPMPAPRAAAAAPAPVGAVAQEAKENEKERLAGPLEAGGEANNLRSAEQQSGSPMPKQAEAMRKRAMTESKAPAAALEDGRPGDPTLSQAGENRSRGAANGKGEGSPPAPASPVATGAPPAADAKSDGKLKAFDAGPGNDQAREAKKEVAAAPPKPAENAKPAGQGADFKAGNEGKGRDESLRQDAVAAQDKSKETAQDRIGTNGAGGGSAPTAEKPNTAAARRAGEEETRKAPGEKKAAAKLETAKDRTPGAPPAAFAGAKPHATAADPGKYGAPIRLTLKSDDPQAFAALVRATAKASGATVATPKPQGGEELKERKADTDAESNKKQGVLAAQATPLTMTFSVPASKREAFMKEMTALKLKSSQRAAKAKGVADDSKEKDGQEKLQKNAVPQADADKVPAKKPDARAAVAEDDEVADAVAVEQKKSAEELVQIIIVVEAEE